MTCNTPDRIYAQYRTKNKATRWYAITRDIADQLCEVAQDVAESYDIDTATGDELNTIGRIVVIDRSTVVDIPLGVIQFDEDVTGQMGDVLAMFSDTNVSQSATLSDDFFRTLIKAKIAKNNSDSTIDDIIAAVRFIAPDLDGVKLIDNEDMTFDIFIYGNMSSSQQDILINKEIIPKPQGVLFNGFMQEYSTVQFNDDVTAQMGDDTAQCSNIAGVL